MDVFGGGYITLDKSGTDTLIKFDQDGSIGAGAAITIATVVNATALQSDIDLPDRRLVAG
ncbi:MAG TPA: hypothetical protein VGQ35_16870 [Dongiaceae bacterium]|nr:hypothetical protein [Dongiaceae bacterium]